MSLRSNFPVFAFALFTLSTACSSPSETAVSDAATDTGVAADTATDTKTPVTDTGTPPITCEQALPSDFACAEPLKGTGATTCTETMLTEFVQKCLADDLSVPSTCAEWKTANAACATCVADWSWSEIPGKVYPDDYKCYWGIMDPACAKASNCSFDCEFATCGDCDTATSERDDCIASVTSAGGKCYAVASKTADECFKKYNLDNCNVDEIYAQAPDLTKMREEILRFYRGACRDNGKWENSTSAGDAGTSDTGSTDATTSDTGSSDSATDAADAG